MTVARTLSLLVIFLVVSVPSLASQQDSSILSDLSVEVEEALAAERESGRLPVDPRELLDAILEAAPPFRFDARSLEVQTDRRWFATVSSDRPGSPLLELRRWPGDTVMALYCLDGTAPVADESRPVPGARLEERMSTVANRWVWEGTLKTPRGVYTIHWIEQAVPGARTRLGALLIPGDAGLGSQAASDLASELFAVLDRVDVVPSAWGITEGLAPGTPIVLPSLDSTAGQGDERLDAWQIVEGTDYTLGVPPGIRVRRLDLGIDAPRSVPGAVLWLRGRFVDRDGGSVVIGDRRRFGYVAELPEGEKPEAPVGVPGARLLGRVSYPSADAARTGADIRAERWTEPGFRGEWLVFGLRFESREIEIGMPVVAGEESLALYWMPLTWRGGQDPPAPPPIDPAERFGIDFERFSRLQQKREPWTEGYLRVPGLRLEVPKDWWPSATLRSANGFPVHLIDESGTNVGCLRFLPKDSPVLVALETSEWVPVGRRSPYRAAAAYRRADGARLYVTHEGYGFLLEPDRDARTETEVWDRMAESALVLSPQP